MNLPPVSLPLHLDASELEATARQVLAENGKDLATGFNKKMGWLLRRWLWNMHKADYKTMATKLGMELYQSKAGERKTKTGKVIKFKSRLKANGRTVGNVRSRRLADAGAMVPMIIAMISKRKGGSPMKGKSRKAGQRAMKAAIKSKFGARARSIGYLKSAVASAQKPFLRFSSGPGGAGVPPLDSDRSLKPVGQPKGFGTIATPGDKVLAVATDRSTTKRQGDRALRKYAHPALVKAYREELADTKEYLNKLLYNTARRLGVSANN